MVPLLTSGWVENKAQRLHMVVEKVTQSNYKSLICSFQLGWKGPEHKKTVLLRNFFSSKQLQNMKVPKISKIDFFVSKW